MPPFAPGHDPVATDTLFERRATAVLERHTGIVTPPLCPELRLRLAEDMERAWQAMEESLGVARMPPPLWATAWPGGLALARYLLDHPELVRGRRVLDLGSGSGLCAIAAALAGAAEVRASEIDAMARLAIALNAELNGVAVEIDGRDLIGRPQAPPLVVLAGDLWYERLFAERATPWLQTLARAGCTVLLGDKGREHFPRLGLVALARYSLPTPPWQEPTSTTEAGVFRFAMPAENPE